MDRLNEQITRKAEHEAEMARQASDTDDAAFVVGESGAYSCLRSSAASKAAMASENALLQQTIAQQSAQITTIIQLL